jgi:hypothetical protein
MNLAVEIFVSDDIHSLQRVINSFLSKNYIELHDIKFSTSECEATWTACVIIIYKTIQSPKEKFETMTELERAEANNPLMDRKIVCILK